jgi:putative effector of murein hydrolase
VVIARVTGTVKEPEAELLPLSVTFTVNVASTTFVGAVPDRTPAVVMVSHVGKPVADQLYPPAPPEAANVWL